MHKIWKSVKLSLCLPNDNALALYLLYLHYILHLITNSITTVIYTFNETHIFKLKTHHKLCNNYVIVYEDCMASTLIISASMSL